MDFAFTGSQSQSPSQSQLHGGLYLDSNSEGSSPDMPYQVNQMIFDSPRMQYETRDYGTTPSNFYPFQLSNDTSTLPSGSSALDNDRDRRQRRSASSSTSSKEKEVFPDTHLRRRAQNRASQRAFRERKEQHVKGLEHQLEDLHEKHQDLLQSFTRQTDEVTKLNSRIAELSSELNSLRSGQGKQPPPPSNELLLPERFDKFDAFSAHDAIYNDGSGCYLDDETLGLASDFSIHGFEDTL